MALLHPTLEYDAFRQLDLVVEAVFEDAAVKHQVLREVEAVAPESLIFASNTSTIPIAEIAQASARPEQVVGMHFFSPVHKMPLVEVIRHPGTRAEVVATTVALGRTMGKTVIVVNDGPGFFTSRVLAPFLNEAVWCLVEGATIEEVDGALKGWGWPAGGSAARRGGHRRRYHTGPCCSRLGAARSPRRSEADRRRPLGRKVARGSTVTTAMASGRQGATCRYARLEPRPIDAGDIAERCWLQMLNGWLGHRVGIVTDPDVVDIGVIFGLGFPPFRGGILREADRVGLDEIVLRLDGYAARHGKRLAPAPLLREMAARGERFHV
jgi:3-hydroxyacyl-CoA dehydrogenase/enoyl-CoA hydratase/3-hydroxybutyryl-CoA epimerase